MTYREVLDKAMPEETRKAERFEYLYVYVTRPLSIWLTIPFINTNVTPTDITKVSILFSTFGFFLLSFGQTMFLKVLGWICFFMWGVFDGVDGNLARATNRCSTMGMLWDSVGGYASLVYIYFACGIAAFFDNNLFSFCDNYWMLILGGATAVFSIFPRLVMHKRKSSEGSSELTQSFSTGQKFSIKKFLAKNLIAPTGFMIIFLLIAIVFHMINIFLAGYAFINFAVMMISLKQLLSE